MMKYLNIVKISGCLISIFMLVAFASCQTKPGKTKAEVINERIQLKIDRWRASVIRKCDKDVLETATIIVDSTMIANARFQKDTIGKPAKPFKPYQPEFEVPIDSVPIAPLIEPNLDSLGGSLDSSSTIFQ